MSTRTPARLDAAGWPIKDSTPKPLPTIAIESDSPDVSDDFLTEVSTVDETWLAVVPEHLRETYLGLKVPSDIATMAVQGKSQSFEIVDIDPALVDKAEYDTLKRQATGRTPGTKETLHNWRLNEAARLHEQQERFREIGYYVTDCPSCGAGTYASQLGAIQLDNGRTFTGCQLCRDTLNEEHRHRQREADPYLIARRKAIAAALADEEAAS